MTGRAKDLDNVEGKLLGGKVLGKKSIVEEADEGKKVGLR